MRNFRSTIAALTAVAALTGAFAASAAPVRQASKPVALDSAPLSDVQTATPAQRPAAAANELSAFAKERTQHATPSPDGRTIYLTTQGDSSIAVIDPASDSLVTRIPACDQPLSIAFSSTGQRAYVICGGNASVVVIDAAAHKVINTVRVPGAGVWPAGIAVTPDDQIVYVTTARGARIALEAKDCTILGFVHAGSTAGQRIIETEGRLPERDSAGGGNIPPVDPVSMQNIPAGAGPGSNPPPPRSF